MTPRAAVRAAAHITTATAIRRAALALLLAAILLAGGTLGGPRPSSADGTAITANSVAITSTPAAAMDYHAGETITATVTFSSAISAHTNAALTLTFGSGTGTASPTGTTVSPASTTVEFHYVVTSADEDTDGITILANAISGTYQHTGHTGTDHSISAITTGLTTAQTGHKVNSTDTIDYDTDDDRLIEVDSLAKLDAIRYNLSGNGNPTGADADAHNDAFPRPMPYHGCPDTDDADSDPNPCLGYELTANLDFDTNDSGATHTNGVGDNADTYHTHTSAMGDAGEGWVPIGGHAASPGAFSAILEGNDHTISNLYINLNTSGDDDGTYVGLFANTSGTVRNLGLVDPYVKNTRSGAGAIFINSGALSGTIPSGGSVSRVYVSGGQVISVQTYHNAIRFDCAACLSGSSSGTVSDSYATCDATAIGGKYGIAGGLTGSLRGTVRRSYAEGTVTSDFRAGGLVSVANTNAQIIDSYAAGAVSGVSNGITTTGASNDIGGLVGYMNNGSDIINSYAAGAVSSSGSGFPPTGSPPVPDTVNVGGLVGEISGSGTTVTGSYATGAVSTAGNYNAVGGLVGYVHNNAIVTSSYATGTVSVSDAASSNHHLGGLVGRTAGDNPTSIRASYATGSVSTAGGGANHLGGLVGSMNRASFNIRASYASGAVSATGAGANNLGGLVGTIQLSNSSPNIFASYAAGRVSTTSTGANNLGGLVGHDNPVVSSPNRNVFNNTYWDTQATGQTASANLAGGTGYTSTQLQSPDEYGTSPSIYENWNIDVDETGNANDDPWHFGGTSDYPILKFGHDAPSIARQTNAQYAAAEYDTDNDNLIDIATLAQLNAIRYDLDGNGRNTGDDALAYAAAFPGATKSMGCPATCIGYELMDDLDFDYDEDGSTHTAGVIDSDDAVAATAAYFDSTTGWTPIGGHTDTAGSYTAIFEGNGNTIDNLYINLSTSAATDGRHVGLFARIGSAAGGAAGVVRNLGLVDPYVANTRTGATTGIYVVTGALAGRGNDTAAISGSYVSGGSVTSTQNTSTLAVVNNAGGLLGYNLGAVSDSYASCAVQATGNATGGTVDYAGGLAGQSEGAVTRSYATGTVMADDQGGGLFGAMAGGVRVTASYATGTVTVSGAAGRAGGLVGHLTGANTAIAASFATGDATASGGNADAGGLVGRASNGATMAATYATGAATVTGTGAENNAGGLVGELTGTGTNVNASYAIGAVSASGGTANRNGGVAGSAVSSATVTNSYWNNDTVANGGTGRNASAGSAATFGRSGTALKTPTDYGAAAANAFYGWNVDLDGDSNADDPWDFGATTDYPVISYGGIGLRAQNRTPVDYDADNDGLIDIDSLARLNAIRYDLDGDGVHSNTAYNAAFVNRDRSAAGLMGCPLGDHDDDAMTPEQAHCTGYELIADLDFDTDGDGATHTSGTGDSDDDYYNSDAGWVPIGGETSGTGYSGVFEGNRHIIDNLFIKVPASSATGVRFGLFTRLESDSVIRGVGLTDAYVSRTTNNAGRYAGALAGQSWGTITASSATGEVSLDDDSGTTGSLAGGLVGAIGKGGAITASYANVTVTIDSDTGRAGGLVGSNLAGAITASHAFGAVTANDSPSVQIGGLVGHIGSSTDLVTSVVTPATITASYARGAVRTTGTGTSRVLGGLVAGSGGTTTVTNSYYDNTVNTGATFTFGTAYGRATTALQTPVGYTGIYEDWNVNVDGVTGNDDPWHFGTASQYPVLKYGGFSPTPQGSTGEDYDDDNDNLIDIRTLAQLDAIRYDMDGNGRPTDVLAYLSAFPLADAGSAAEMGSARRMGCAAACAGYELRANLDFDTDGDGATHTNGVGDPDDDYYTHASAMGDPGEGWVPIGGHNSTHDTFNTILNGNNHTISNLYINLRTSSDGAGSFVGLFAHISSGTSQGRLRNLGLVNPYVKNARSGRGTGNTGALAGESDAITNRLYVSGGQVAGGDASSGATGTERIGCLYGINTSEVNDSYATCDVTAVGGRYGNAGGLVGYSVNTVRRSYATGDVTSNYRAGGLVSDCKGFPSFGIRCPITDSYATGNVTLVSNGYDDHVEAGGLVGRSHAAADIINSYATGAVTSSANEADVGGLVGHIDDAHVRGSYATGAVSSSGSDNSLGGLVGALEHDDARVAGSYATGAVSTSGSGANNLGGLIGKVGTFDARVRAAYASGAVSDTGSGANNLGGLVGYIDNSATKFPRIVASYARGAVSTSSSGSSNLGGLVGGVATTGSSVFTATYWDRETTGQATSADLAGDDPQTTASLQNLTDYADIYSTWNIDVDQTGNANDDPWDFGNDSEYPVLVYGATSATGQGRTLVDYDTDNDGLIDIKTLAQLDAVRYDLNGDGDPTNPSYRSAYPNRDGAAAGRMGCPAGACTGYELFNDLDFDTDGDGSTHTGGTSDDGDDYHNGGAGWSRIGDGSTPYSATFDGKGHTIDNLFMRNRDGQRFGLFGELAGSGEITSLGVRNAYVTNASGTEPQNVGILVGLSNGDIVASYTTGTVRGYDAIGGLVGYLGNVAGGSASITASYSTAAVHSDSGFGIAGGLAGQTRAGSINQSYYAGPNVSGPSARTGGLLGERVGGGTTTVSTDSYWDKSPGGVPNTSPQSPDAAGKTTAELQAPVGYAGSIYANWNVNLDGQPGNDDPWDFRFGHYPVLKYGGFDVDKQRPVQATVGADAQAYSGQTVTLEGSGRASHGATLGASPYRWTVSDPDGLDPATLTLSGAETARLTFTAPTGLTTDKALVFRLTVTGTVGGRTVTVFDEVTVNVVAVRPNQLLSLSLSLEDAEGDAVGLAPPFVSLRYDYRASVANQIGSVTVTPRLLEGSTMTLNGQAVSSGAEVEVPLKYRGNEITIVVTPPEPEPSETMNGETTDGDTTDETVAETPCSVENDGIKPCTYTVTVNRAVPPRLAFVPRSLTIEEGSSATYTVELDTRILTGAVTIAIASDNPDVTVSPTEVTLRPLDMAPRTITVTAASDADRNNESAVITHTANGAHYYDVIATVGVTVNDTTAPPPAPDPALSVSATALRLAEGGSRAYTVALSTRPADNVTVTIASDNADVTTRPATLSFTTANWSTAQRVTVSAAADGDTANDTATLTHTASGGGYGAAPAVSITVSVTDGDTAGLSITPTVLNLIENGISAYIVSLTAQPSGNVTVAIASDNPDVTVRPTALTFTPANWATPQAVLVITRADDGGGDELATLRMTARGGGYAGQTGRVLASVDDTLAPLPAGSVTTSPDAPAGVSVYGPPGTTARATVSPPAADTPTVATGAGFGIGSAVAVSVSDAPDDGLEICLPVSDTLRAEVNSALILTLLRYAGGSWTELDGARDLGDRVCAGGVTGQAAYAAAYALPPGTVLDLAASVGDTPGTIALSWTPPAAGASQVAVVVNIADDTDYCLDTLPGLDASSYTCAGRRAGATYVALLIVLLPDGGYTLANIVRFDLPAAGGQ